MAIPDYVLILDAHPAEDGRIQKHIRFLQGSGYTVYHLHFIPYAADPGIADGNYSLFGEKSRHINLHWKIRFKGMRLLNYLSLFSPALAKKTADAIQALGVPLATKGIIHVHDPILLPLAQKIQCKWLTHAKIVYDRHEVYEDMKRFAGIGGYRLFERIAGNSISGVVVVSERFKEIGSHFFPKLKIVSVPNFPLDCQRDSDNILKKIESFSPETPLICIYIGSLRRDLDRDIDLLLTIADEILTRFLDATIIIGGPCTDKKLGDELKTLEEKFPERFVYMGTVPHSRVMEVTATAHIGFHFMKSSANCWTAGSSTKIFEYLATGTIPVARTEFDYREDLCSCGLLFDRDTPRQTIVQQLFMLLEDTNRIQKMMVLSYQTGKKFSYENAAENYLTLYETILN